MVFETYLRNSAETERSKGLAWSGRAFMVPSALPGALFVLASDDATGWTAANLGIGVALVGVAVFWATRPRGVGSKRFLLGSFIAAAPALVFYGIVAYVLLTAEPGVDY